VDVCLPAVSKGGVTEEEKARDRVGDRREDVPRIAGPGEEGKEERPQLTADQNLIATDES
jgi:hypothetical protein